MSLHWLGHLLRNVRAGEQHSFAKNRALAGIPEAISLTSPWYKDGQPMPLRCAGAGVGENVSPPLAWSHVPAGTVELALVMEDPDVPFPRPIIHMIAYKIAPDHVGSREAVPEGFGVAEGGLGAGASGILFGKGTMGKLGYTGPRPPSGHGPHRYIFHVLALNRHAEFQAPPKLNEFMAGVAGSIIGRGSLVGIFEQE
jgi:Raf kinase inhibitor-like YbhB/YbcL family protein